MTPERLREIAGAAMPGPWSVDPKNMIRLQTPVAPPLGLVWSDSKRDQNAVLIALAPELARVAADLAEAARAYQALFKAWEGRDNLTLNDEALRQWKSIADVSLAAFAELGEQDDTQAATEVRVSGEESKATTGTVT